MPIYKANKSPYRDIDVISTGLPQLDKITGISGIPTKRITEISGPPSIGKTTLALNIIAQAQKLGMKTLFLDSEWTFLEQHAEICGVILDKLDLLQSPLAEDMLDEVEKYISKHKNACVVIDSIGGLHSRQEFEKSVGEKVIGVQAGLIARFCRHIVPLLAINNVALIVLNHEFVDLFSGREMTSGGAKLAFHKSLWIKLKMKSGTVLKAGDKRVGEKVIVQIRKNKVGGLRHAECELSMIYGRGFAPEFDILEQAIEKGVVHKSGNSFFFGKEKLAVGMQKTRAILEENQELLAKIRSLLE